MRVLSLFSGIGAHDLGLEWAGMKIVGQVEIDEFSIAALNKHWPDVPKWTDIRTVSTDDIRCACGNIDIITGGFPCQDISTAGKQAGIEGERSGLWREMWRIIRDLRPNWLLIENVPALRTKGADTVLGALEELGYSCWPLVVGAIHSGAPHQRLRVLIIARLISDSNGVSGRTKHKMEGKPALVATKPKRAKSESSRQLVNTESPRLQAGGGANEAALTRLTDSGNPHVPDADEHRIRHQSVRLPERKHPSFAFPRGPGPEQHGWEEPRTIESPMDAPVDGDARRLARWRRESLKAIGNANPPQTFYLIGLAIMEIENEQTN